MATLKFLWSDYKSDHDSRSVHFAGGFTLYVAQHGPPDWKPCGVWRVRWWVPAPKGKQGSVPAVMRGLTDQVFGTRLEAQRAAERVFVPVARIAHELVGPESRVVLTVGDSVWAARKRRRK